MLKKLERKGLAIQDGKKYNPGDMGGMPSLLWWTFEREAINAPEFASEADIFADKKGINTSNTTSERAPDAIQAKPKQIIPCHPVESKVTYEEVWTVAEINLATGMHT